MISNLNEVNNKILNIDFINNILKTTKIKKMLKK